MMRRLVWLVVPVAAVALALGLHVDSARAGDRELEILIVNMTPGPTTAESRRCFARVQRRIGEDYSNVHRIGETRLRRIVGRPEGEWMDLSSEELARVNARLAEREEYLDSVALVDCRPEEQRVDLLVSSPRNGLARMRLRDVPVDARRARWIGDTILRQAWPGFSP